MPAANASSSTAISLRWGPPLPEYRNGDIIGYVVNITNLDNGNVQQLVTAMVSNMTVSNLMPFTIYVVTISARTAIGMGPFSSVVSVQTIEDGKRDHGLVTL